MLEIDALEAGKSFDSLLDRVEDGEDGEEIVITRQGRFVARLVQDNSEARRQDALAAMERIRARGAALKLGPFDWEEIKKDRDEGRP